jgi:hypothetical protein
MTIDAQEQQVVAQIANDYFLKELGSQKEADKALSKLGKLVQDKGAKLVHLGNVLFLVIVRGKGVVEVHTIGTEANPMDLVKDFVDLTKYLKNIKTKVAYTYSEDNKFSRIAKLTGLPIKQKKAVVDGKDVNVYILEF